MLLGIGNAEYHEVVSLHFIIIKTILLHRQGPRRGLSNKTILELNFRTPAIYTTRYSTSRNEPDIDESLIKCNQLYFQTLHSPK